MAKLKGTWRFNDVLNLLSSGSEAMQPEIGFFTPNSFYYSDMNVTVTDEPKFYNFLFVDDTSIMYSPDSSDYTPTYDIENGWNAASVMLPLFGYTVNGNLDGYGQTITFTEEQEVDDDFYAWFTANANEVVEETPIASIQYNGQTIASLMGGQKATLACAGMKMETDVVVEVAEAIGGGGECDKPHVIEVDTLPTENIDTNALYLCDGAYYKGGTAELVDVMVNGVSFGTNFGNAFSSYTYYYATTKPTQPMETVFSSGCHIYYVEDENDLFWFIDFEGTGEASWYSLSFSSDATFDGVINDASEAITSNFYAVVKNGWTKYLAPTDTLEITENGEHDVTEYASVEVNVPTGGGTADAVLQEKSITITENTTEPVEIEPDSGYDGLSKIVLVVNVASGGGGESEGEGVDELQGTWTVNDQLYNHIEDLEFFVSGYFAGIASLSNTYNPQTIPLKRIRIGATGNYAFRLSSNTDGSYPFSLTSTRGMDVNNQRWAAQYSESANSYALFAITTAAGDSGANVIAGDTTLLRTFTITSKLSEVENGDVLLDWLKANATKK